jgi:ATP diphosphatase
MKAEEHGRHAGGSERVLEGVGAALPALARAAKLGRRAASVGFDWANAAGVIEKVREEISEVEAANAGNAGNLGEEIGDLLFSVANLARHADVDPEEALRCANRKFERRFASVEDAVRASGRKWSDFSAEELETYWTRAKQTR